MDVQDALKKPYVIGGVVAVGVVGVVLLTHKGSSTATAVPTQYVGTPVPPTATDPNAIAAGTSTGSPTGPSAPSLQQEVTDVSGLVGALQALQQQLGSGSGQGVTPTPTPTPTPTTTPTPTPTPTPTTPDMQSTFPLPNGGLGNYNQFHTAILQSGSNGVYWIPQTNSWGNYQQMWSAQQEQSSGGGGGLFARAGNGHLGVVVPGYVRPAKRGMLAPFRPSKTDLMLRGWLQYQGE